MAETDALARFLPDESESGTDTGAEAEPVHVPREIVRAGVLDARSVSPSFVHRTVALSISRGSERTAQLRLDRLARVVMSGDRRIQDPRQVWAADWSRLSVPAIEALDRSIRESWHTVSSRNAMRDSVRAVIRESLAAGILTSDQAMPLLNAVRPEKSKRDVNRQARGHLPADRSARVFHELALEPGVTARRDAALIALLLGAGLRRGEACSLMLADLDEYGESAVVTGKGDVVRDVPFASGVRRAVRSWLEVRGSAPGPLLSPISKTAPRYALAGRTLSTNTVAQVVQRRVGDDVSPHDLRRTFTGDLLDSGADLSVVSKVLGHVNPATTAGYDRRGFAAQRTAVDRLFVAFEEPVASSR